MSSKLFSTAIIVLISALIVRITIFCQPPDQESLSDQKLQCVKVVPIPRAVGPESFAFDPHGGGPYVGVSDGRIIKWQGDERQWIDFAVTSPEREFCQRSQDHHRTEEICGRPLGLCFSKETGELYIADAYMGLLVVGPYGGLATRILTHVQGNPLKFTNAVEIDQRSGILYFTDSSTRYQRRNYLAASITRDKTGRLLKYDPQTKQVSVLLDHLLFANGVALAKDGDFILVAEATGCRILRYWVQTPRAGTHDIFVNLPGFPDNLRRNSRGEFWVGIHSRRTRIAEVVLSYPWIGKMVNMLLNNLPFDPMKLLSLSVMKGRGGMAIRLSEEGEVLEELEDKSGHIWSSISEVHERDNTLWVGSIDTPFAGMYRYQNEDKFSCNGVKKISGNDV